MLKKICCGKSITVAVAQMSGAERWAGRRKAGAKYKYIYTYKTTYTQAVKEQTNEKR